MITIIIVITNMNAVIVINIILKIVISNKKSDHSKAQAFEQPHFGDLDRSSVMKLWG